MNTRINNQDTLDRDARLHSKFVTVDTVGMETSGNEHEYES